MSEISAAGAAQLLPETIFTMETHWTEVSISCVYLPQTILRTRLLLVTPHSDHSKLCVLLGHCWAQSTKEQLDYCGSRETIGPKPL